LIKILQLFLTQQSIPDNFSNEAENHFKTKPHMELQFIKEFRKGAAPVEVRSWKISRYL
jgi:hypothetical protein